MPNRVIPSFRVANSIIVRHYDFPVRRVASSISLVGMLLQMERSTDARHRHHHRGQQEHHDARPKKRNEAEKLSHRAVEGTAHRSSYGPAHTPAPSYLDAWLDTQAPATVSTFKLAPVGEPENSKRKETPQQHQRQPSHDSSIIAPAAPQLGRSRQTQHMHNASNVSAEPQVRHNTVSRKRPASSPSVEAISDDRGKEEARTFEKRARHKTREDKYEQNRGGAARRKRVKQAPKSKEKEAHDRRTKKKSALATAGDLMDRFSSRAIHNDRLTMKSSIQPGMFGNVKVGKAPGDLIFGEMNFLKEARPQEGPKTVPRYRSSDQKRNHQEVEDIEVFFSRRKPEPATARRNKPERPETAHRNSSQRLDSRDDGLRARTRSTTVREGSRPTTYFSWSSSHHSPPEAATEKRNGRQLPVLRDRFVNSLSPIQSAGSAAEARENSPTPEPIRQSLIETGVYRTLSALESHVPDMATAHSEESHVDRQSPEEPMRPGNGYGYSRTQPLLSSASYGTNARYDQVNGMQAESTVSTARPVLSPATSAMHNHSRSRAAMAPPARPLSRSKQSLGRAGFVVGRPPSVFEPPRWLPTVLPPHSQGRPEHHAYDAQLPRLPHHEEWPPEADARECAISLPRLSGSVYGRTDNSGRDALGPDLENHPSDALRDSGSSHWEPYAKPFFRHGSTAGYVPSFNTGATEHGPLRSQSTRPQLVGNVLGIAPQFARQPGLPSARQDAGLDETRQEGGSHGARGLDIGEAMARYWKPNTYGL